MSTTTANNLAGFFVGAGMIAPIERFHTARKVHACARCPQAINPGDRYVRTAVPAWMDAEGDVDDEGRTVYNLLPAGERRWYSAAYHVACFDRLTGDAEGYYFDNYDGSDDYAGAWDDDYN